MAILDLATYKAYIGKNSDTDDAEITKVIGSVNAFIPSYCNRTFIDYYSSEKTELFDATCSDYYVEEFPLGIITSVKYSSEEDGVFDTELVEYTDYMKDEKNSRIISIGNKFITATVALNSGQIIYKGGLAAYPEDIVHAAVLLTEYYMESAYIPRKALAGASVDSTVYDFTARLPAHIRRILEHHRAWNP